MSNLTNSSNVSLISSESKFIELIFGLALTRTGGILSTGPPVGEPRFAHPLITTIDKTVYIKFLIVLIQLQINVFKIVKRTIFTIY